MRVTKSLLRSGRRRFVCGATVALLVAGLEVGALGSDPAFAAPGAPAASPSTDAGSSATHATTDDQVGAQSAISDASSAPDAASALAIAETFGHPVTVDGATTETSLTYAESDGSLQTEQHSVPQRVQQSDDSWAPVDENLVRQPDGSYAPAVSPRPVEFTGGGEGAASPLATVTTATGSPITVTSSVLATGTPTVSGATATYADVLPGVDLLLTATPDGMSEVLQVNSPQAAQNPSLSDLSFGIGGASLVDGSGHAATATAADGSTVVTPAPTWWDAGNGGTAAGPGGSDVPIPLADAVSQDHFTLDVGAAAVPGVTYPLFVDPDFTNGQNGRTFTDNAYPSVAYWNGAGASDSYQHVGYIDAANSDDGRSHVTRSYWNIPLPQEPSGSHVSSSTFNVQNVYSESCTTSPTTLFWTPTVGSGTTWSNQPGTNANLDSQTFAHGHAGCGVAYVGFDATSAVSQQIAGNAGQITLMLEGTENNITSWKKFAPDVTLTTTVALPPTAPSIIDNTCHRSPGLITGDVLHAGEKRTSLSGQFSLNMQTDGNLVERKSGVAVWQSQTAGAGTGGYAVLQTDGNFVVRNSAGAAQFNTGTAGVHGVGPTSTEDLVVQDDGNLVLYTNDGGPAWNAHSGSVAADPAWTCFSNAGGSSGRQQITVQATNGNPANQFYEFHEMKNGASFANGTTQPTPTGSGVPATWTASTTEDATYIFYARACLQARDGFFVCGSNSPRIGVVVDTQAPATPTLTAHAVSGPAVSTDPHNPAGTVGQSVLDVNVSAPPAADAVAGYEWTVQVPTSGPTSFTGSSTALCGTANAGYTVLCTGDPSDTPDIQMTPTAETNQVDVTAFDLAGNTSTPGSATSTPGSTNGCDSGAGCLNFYSLADPNVLTGAHIWNTDSQPTSGCTGSIADSNSAGHAATLVGGICWGTDNPGGTTEPVLTATGTAGARAATSAGVVDTTKSFTVGAWLKTTVSEPANVGMTALSQQGGHESAFDLQDSGGRWGICMPSTDSASYSGVCVRAGSTAFVPGAWKFVVAEWDAINQQLRIFTDDGSAGASNWQTTASFSPVNASSGQVWIGSGVAGSTEQPFNGEISDPFIASGLVSLSQMKYFANGGVNRPVNNAQPGSSR